MKKNYLLAFVLCTLNFAAFSQTIDLFNGKDLSNWGFVLKDSSVNPKNIFRVHNGEILILGEPFGYMYTNDKYDNFHLHVEWRWPSTPKNSGIFVFVQDDNKVWPNAIECQLHAGDAGDFVLLGGSQLAEFKTPEGEERPEFPVVKKQAETSEMKAREWNNADIICKKGNITVFINGVLQNKGSKPKYKSGRIALQSEGKEIYFRNVRLTPIK